ncbi:MAG: AAA family ATPase [Selenomonadaceae bacterium]|nr:AAA family ATPase [Selenomonadaceae bacterium]
MAYQRKAGNLRTIWKINHHPKDFSDYEWRTFIEQRVIILKSNSDQCVDRFIFMKRDDYFYLCHGDEPKRAQSGTKLIGRIIDDVPEIRRYSGKNCWIQRHYEMIYPTDGIPLDKIFYNEEARPYTPNFSLNEADEIIYEVSKDEAKGFEEYILDYLFGLEIKDLKGLWDSYANQSPSVKSPSIKFPLKIFPLNQILYGVPGTSKTFSTVAYAVAICGDMAVAEALLPYDSEFISEIYDSIKNRYDELKKNDRINFVTFHQSYGYEDFIEGIKPNIDERGNVSYSVASGVFKQFCEMAAENPAQNYVFIIDEINRGNISKIFGELITLIEDDKRGEISVTLPYSQETFTVPKNVYILGTMNTADRSIALMDTALRRRFNFVEMMPRPELLSENVDGVNLQKLLETLNTRIETLLDREHTIGHAYFIKCKTIADIAEVFRNKVIPLLQEYFYDDYEQIRLVLGEKFIRKEKLPALGDVDEKYRYTIDNAAFDDAASYQL